MLRLVVFKTPAELERLRELLYGDASDQDRGLALCKAYQTRGSLPPSVHVTCLLLAALRSDVPECDLYSIRLTYSMALVRFVNEILDAAQAGKAAAAPLHALAVEIDLPNSFVELRHAATHEDLPSLGLLRDMARRGLAWLWDGFWRHQGEGSSGGASSGTSRRGTPQSALPPQEAVADPSAQIKELLKQWRRLKRADASAMPPPALVASLQRELAANEPEFLAVVVTRNILIPAGSGTIPKRGASVVALWLPLFQQLGPRFCQALAARVVAALSLREWPVDPRDSQEVRKFPMLQTWAETLAPYLSPDTVQTLCAVPRPWNAVVAALYAARHRSAEVYATAEKMARLTGASIVPFPASAGSAATTPGWTKVEGWTPRPLGIY